MPVFLGGRTSDSLGVLHSACTKITEGSLDDHAATTHSLAPTAHAGGRGDRSKIGMNFHVGEVTLGMKEQIGGKVRRDR